MEMSIQWFVNVDMIWCDIDMIIYRSYNDGTVVYGIYANILEYNGIYIYIGIYTLDLKGYDHL